MNNASFMASSLRKLLALFLLLGILGNHVHARFVVETESIRVLSPLSMRGKHDGAIGNFGVPDYGGFIVGSVVYPDKGSSGCQPFEGDKPFKPRFPRLTVLLLDRGGNNNLCSALLSLSL